MRWSIQTKWSKWLQDMKELEQVAVPRCYFSSLPDSMEKEIHAFCDAPKNAYAGVIYIRTVTLSGTAHTSVFKAKTRVAPLKTMTLPRLELNGALIAARLCSYVKQVLKCRIQRTICWTDSSADSRPFWTVQTVRSEPGQRDQQFNRASVLEVWPQRWQLSRFTIQRNHCNSAYILQSLVERSKLAFSARIPMIGRLKDYRECTRGRESFFGDESELCWQHKILHWIRKVFFSLEVAASNRICLVISEKC